MKNQIFKLLLISSIFAIGFSACEKEEDSSSTTYELRFTNTSSNPYQIQVDGTTSSLSGNTFKEYSLKKGTYSWKVTQISGYLMYPTIQEGTVNLDQDKEIVFP